LSEYEYLKSETTKTWVCSHSKCDVILKTQKNKDNIEKPLLKQPCGHNYYEDHRRDCYVLFLPIEQNHLSISLNIMVWMIRFRIHPPNSRGDVNTGDIYRKLREEDKIDENTVTGQINLDGASAFKVHMNPTWCSKKMYKTAWY
jgi:hypothetical protein